MDTKTQNKESTSFRITLELVQWLYCILERRKVKFDHYIDLTWASWRLRSTAIWAFDQQFALANFKGASKLRVTDPLLGEFNGNRRLSSAEMSRTSPLICQRMLAPVDFFREI